MKQSLKTKSFRHYPAEWQKQKCIWLSWPHNEKEWGKRKLEKIRDFYIKLISLILDFQGVNLIFKDEKLLLKTKLSKELEKKKYKLKKIIIPNNDIWIRDYGPFFMSPGPLLDFQFNSYGGKFPPWDKDNNVPKEIAKYYQCELESYPLIMEGGSLEFNGEDVIMTTEQCLLNKNRNPKLKKEEIECYLKSVFNIKEILWLKRGLEGDHTDGHIDDVARFVGKRTIVICSEKNKKDKNYKHLKESIEYLKNWKHPKLGYKLKIIELPMPSVGTRHGMYLPASYANFIFVNGGIIVPIFNSPNDKKALLIFKKLFPKRKIVGIDSTTLIEQGGGLHCMSKQEPI